MRPVGRKHLVLRASIFDATLTPPERRDGHRVPDPFPSTKTADLFGIRPNHPLKIEG